MSLQYKTASDHPQDWKGGIQDYLRQHQIACDKITPFSGGMSCYLWRLDGLRASGLPTPEGFREGEPVVLKCADSIAKAVPFPVSAERLRLEIKALGSRAVAEACRQEPSVRVPSVLRATRNGYLMTWGGETDLRTAYKEKGLLAQHVADIGTRLGTWLGALHLAGTEADKEGWSSQHAEVAQFAAPGALEEQALLAAMARAGSSTADIEHALRVLHRPSRLLTLTPWDFRPMNTLLHSRGPGAAPEVTVVDWEMTVYGDPVNDLRLWAAEAMVLEGKFGGGGHRQLLSPFLTAYKRKVRRGIVDEDFVCKLAVSVGVFLLIFVPAPFWECSKEEQESWEGTALQYIQAGSKGDLDWLQGSALRALLDD